MPSGVTIPLTIQVFKGPNVVRTEKLTQDVIKIGKLSSSHLQLDDESVSRMHAVIEVSPTREVTIVDLGSTKGTYVNGVKISPKSRLSSGDEVKIGDVRLVVTIGAAEGVSTGADPTMQADAGEMARQSTSRPTSMGVPTVQPPGPISRPGIPSVPVPPPMMAPVPPPVSFAAPPPMPMGGVPSPFGAPQHGAAATPMEMPSHILEQVEVRDGSHSIEVSAMFEDAVLEIRHFDDPQGGQVSGATKGLLAGGIGALAALFILFVVSYAQVASFKHMREAAEHAGKKGDELPQVPREGPARDIASVVLLLLGSGLLVAGINRREQELRPNEFTIGPARGATFPAPGDGLPRELFPLVRSTGSDFEVLWTTSMAGDAQIGGINVPVSELASSGRARPSSVVSGAFSMVIPQGARFNLRYGENTYNVRSVPKPRRYPVPFAIDWGTQSYTGAVFAAVALFLLMIFSVPPDPKSLSLDAFMNDQRLAKFLIKPEEQKPEEIPDWLKKKQEEEKSGGQRAKEETGKMGKKDSQNKTNTFAIKGPKTNVDIQLAKEQAKDAALKSGVLGLLKSGQSSAIASIFGRDSALGRDAEDAMGGLIGTQVGDAYGGASFGLVGSGAGGGGTGEGTIGIGNLGTVGKGGGGAGGGGYGSRAGNLKGRKAAAPDVVPGTAEVRGSLDKELIRRIIRRHINEVKFCYEKELTRNQSLQGRVMIQFTIGGNGQVISSIVQSSTMGNQIVEQCIAQAVRRWEFPKPQGGIVVVTYPFVLKTADE